MTLLELTVVLVIVSVILAVTIPNFGPLRTRGQLRTSARSLAALLRYGRGEAIYGHRSVVLRLDVDKAKYRLDLMIDSIPASKREEDGEMNMVESVHTLPNDVYFDRVILFGVGEKPRGDLVEIDITPRGSMTPATIILANKKDRRMTVDVFGTTGAVEVYKGVPPKLDSQ
jgi:hypothetical protein